MTNRLAQLNKLASQMNISSITGVFFVAIYFILFGILVMADFLCYG